MDSNGQPTIYAKAYQTLIDRGVAFPTTFHYYKQSDTEKYLRQDVGSEMCTKWSFLLIPTNLPTRSHTPTCLPSSPSLKNPRADLAGTKIRNIKIKVRFLRKTAASSTLVRRLASKLFRKLLRF